MPPVSITIPVGSRALSGRAIRTTLAAPRGLLVAIHGGGYTSKYFDTPGNSALRFAASAGYNVVAFDRPGYGVNPEWVLRFDDQIAVLATAARWAHEQYGVAGEPALLYGHSIGGMLALLMANAAPAEYLGVSMTGAGARYHDRALAGVSARVADPATGTHSMSGEAARIALFMGPAGGFDPAIARLDPERDVPSAVADLRDALAWGDRLRIEAARLTVPVHFVVPEHDGLWRADAEAMQGVREMFSATPFADVYVQRGAGHCVELQHLGFAHVMKVVAFAEECRLLRLRRE